MSGISPSDDAKAKYQLVKTGKQSFGIFQIQDEKTVECTHAGDKYEKGTAEFEAECWATVCTYVEENLADHPAYIVAPFKFTTTDGREGEKLVLISWCPENKVKVKAKMLHGSTLSAIKNTFDGIQMKPIQASCFGDLAHEDIVKECRAV